MMYITLIQNTRLIRAPIAASLALFLLAPLAQAQEVLFEDDFDEETINTGPNPVWDWGVNNDYPRKGMMVGENDIYEVVEGEEFMSHRRSLRLNFSGRNDFCNTCGGDFTEVSQIQNGQACVLTEATEHESFVYNLTNYFATWEVTETSSDNTEVCFDTAKPIEEPMENQSASVNEGDAIFVPNVCGINGTVGGNIDRRNDCNKAINYLDGVSSDDLDYGETIARRFYLYIPEETVIPERVLKLGYSYWKQPDQAGTNSVITLAVHRNTTMGLVLPNGDNVVYSNDDLDAPRVGRDQWYYFEEVFTRESSSSASDAEYKLFMGTSNDDLTTPVVSRSGMSFGNLTRMSIGGNWQHHDKVSGYLYFDNIKIAKGYIGPTSRPKPPQ